MSVNGIDVSKWQGSINWDKVKNSGIKFVMVRASYGKSQKDRYFDENVANAQKAGLDTGAYHYCMALSEEEAVKEADFFISIIKKYEFSYPVAVDMEDASLTNLSKDKITDITLAFLARLKEFNFYPMVYANKYWLTKYLDVKRLNDYSIWLAEYRDGAYTYSGKVDIWQKSSTGIVDGINGNVDMNISYTDFPKIIKSGGYNGMEKTDLSIDEAKKIIREKCGFAEETMLYLSFYKYSDSMIIRLAQQMV